MGASEQTQLVGVDTGGTFTDAVVISATTGEVLHTAKALTTRQDLAIGVSEALTKVVSEVDVDDIALVSVSTTLATNAVVEGHGSPILVLLAGFDDKMVERTQIASAFGDAEIVQVSGGHDHFGSELAELDLECARAALAEHGSTVRAVAVASTFAVRNPEHEHKLSQVVEAETDLPVTISSSLSDSLDAPRRALTTALNARLLSRITDLLSAVDRSLAGLGITAPVMVAKGDGSLAIAESVARRPIETILSGPAASIVGAGVATGLDDFILSDIGGTTTDVAMVQNGRLKFVNDGASVGGWRTMVEAIDVRTSGLGGDSAVRTDKVEIALGPERRIPISLEATNHPLIVAALRKQLAEPPSRDFAGVFLKTVDSGHADEQRLSSIEQRVLGQADTTPAPLIEVARGALERRAVKDLAEKGLVQLVGFTPSDAAHVLGMQANWSAEAAQAAAELMAWFTGETADDFCRRVWSETVRRSAGCILDVAFDGAVPQSLANPVVATAASGNGVIGGVSVALELTNPLIAVGGPAGIYYPEVAERIGAQLILPDYFEVTNAIGAASGHVVARSVAEVHADGPGSFRVVGPEGSSHVEDGEAAIEQATVSARSLAKLALDERLAHLSGGPIEEIVDVTRHGDPNETNGALYGAKVEVELRAKPKVGSAS